MDSYFLDMKFDHIFVDFDSTLYLHDNIDELDDTKPEYNYVKILKGEKIYDVNKLNKPLIEYLMQASGTKHLVSWCNLSIGCEHKFKFINSCYPGLFSDWIATGSKADKIVLLKAYVEAGVAPGTILMIDDVHEVVDGCKENHFYVQEPQFIMNLMQQKKDKENQIIVRYESVADIVELLQ